jgi:hypothetical protein
MGELLLLKEPRQRSGRKALKAVYFARHELNQLLSLYSRRVATAEWRDYAIDHRPGFAIFSIFRHSHETPLYSVVKMPGQGGRSAEYQVLSGQERLARGAALGDVLTLFERKLRVVS